MGHQSDNKQLYLILALNYPSVGSGITLVYHAMQLCLELKSVHFFYKGPHKVVPYIDTVEEY